MRLSVPPIRSWKPTIVIALIVAGITDTRFEELSAGAAQTAPPRDGPARPKIVQVTPADGATDVDPDTEIRIRFDRPMDPSRMLLEWPFAKTDAGFRIRGDTRYSADTHEFAIPVRLTPSTTHQVASGANRRGGREGFQSVDHVEAEPFAWSFTTAKPAAKGGPPPRLVSVSPTPDTEVARLTVLELTFDRPMDPTAYDLKPSEPLGHDRHFALIGQPDYDPANHRFAITLNLPANWNGDLSLMRFRGQDGVEVDPFVLSYRTRRRLVSESLRAKIEEGGRSDLLRQVVDKSRKARREVSSVSEEVVTTDMTGLASPDWCQSYVVQGSRFAMQGDRKFVAEIDGIMGSPFRVGSDGENCWWRGNDAQAVVPFGQVAEKNLSICDAFDAKGPADAAQIIRDRRLQYAGEAVVRGRRCHRIRSWELDERPNPAFSKILEWSIDAETFLPARVEMILVDHFFGSHTMDFIYTKLNQTIPDETFRFPADPSAPQPKREPDPLSKGYTRRFLNVIDGAAGRMSVRWGTAGPNGRTSSGLN